MVNLLIQTEADYLADPDNTTNAIFALGVTNPATIEGLTSGVSYVARQFILSPASAVFTPAIPAPINTTAPIVTGDNVLDAELLCVPGEWDYESTFAFQWRRNGSDISGATDATYAVVNADVGQSLTCRVTATGTGGTTSAISNAISIVEFTIPVIDGVPTITGTLEVGKTLSAVFAEVTGNPAPTRTWQWKRSGTNIGSATNATYTLVLADEGETITVVQTETNTLGSDTAESAATAEITSNSAPSVDSVTAGTQNSSGNLPVNGVNLTEDAPNSYYILTTAEQTTLTEAQVRAGNDEDDNPAAEAGTFSATRDSLVTTVTGNSVSTGTYYVYVVYGDAELNYSEPFAAGTTTLDFTAPTLSSLSGTETSATAATWAVTSNEAGGTIFAAAYSTASTAPDSDQLIAGTGGSIVAANSDTTPTADGNNGGTFTGLTASTAYRVAAVQRDSKGNVSSVVTSAEFTTEAATASGFEGDATGSDFGTVLTFNSASTNGTALPTTFTAGKKLVVVNEGNGGTVTGVTIDGVAATQRGTAVGSRTFWEATITGNDTNNIVVTIGAGTNRVAVSMYDVTGKTYQDLYTHTPAGGDGAARTATVDINTSAGDIVVGTWAGSSGLTYTPTNLTVNTDDLGNNLRFLTTASNLNATGATPETFTLAMDGGTFGTVFGVVHYA